MNRLAPARSSLSRRNLWAPSLNSSSDDAGSRAATFSLVIARWMGTAIVAGPLLPEAGDGAGVAVPDRRHLLGLHAPQRLDPPVAARHHLPVAAEEDVEDHADERQEQQDEEPRERDGRLPVVHDQHDDEDEPVAVEDGVQPGRSERQEDGHGGTLSDADAAVTRPWRGRVTRRGRS